MELQCYQPILEVTICFQPLGVACWYWEASARLSDFHGYSPFFPNQLYGFFECDHCSFLYTYGTCIFLLWFYASNPDDKDGYSTLATLTARAGLKLFKIRPKLHMMCHLAYLDYMFVGEMDGSQECSMDGPQTCFPQKTLIVPSDLPSGLIWNMPFKITQKHSGFSACPPTWHGPTKTT